LKPTKGSKESRWQLVWWQFSVPDGKIIRRRQSFDLNSITSLKDRGQRAAAWLVAINGMLQKGYVYVGEVQAPVVVVELTPADRLLPDVFAAFLKTKEKLSQGSYDVHKAILDLLARWCKDNELVTLADLTKEQGQKFLEYLAAYVSPKTKRVLSPKSFNNYGLNLKTFGNWLTEQGWLKRKHHPFQSMKKTKTGNGEKHTPYTQAQLTAILDLAEADPQFYLFLHFLYYTFARPGKEVRLLRVKDLRESTIWISQAHDKNDRGRYCDIPAHLQELITKAGIKACAPHDFVFGSKGVPGEEPRGKKYFYKRMRKVLAQLGLADQGYDLYGMKHSGNIQLWLATKDLRAIQKQNGHSTMAMSETYLRGLGLLQNDQALAHFPRMGELRS
jgi:integrase